MTEFEKSLRALDEETMRAVAEELLTLLTETNSVRPEREVPGGDGQKRRDGETARGSAVGAPAPGGARPEAAPAHRAYPETEGGAPTAEETAREEGESLPEPAVPEAVAGEDREKRESREDREEPETANRTLRAQDGETVDPAEAQVLEEKLQSVSRQRRDRVRQPDGSGENGAHTAAFRGPERQYEGAVGARGTEMRRISDYFRRDSRRYNTGFTTY